MSRSYGFGGLAMSGTQAGRASVVWYELRTDRPWSCTSNSRAFIWDMVKLAQRAGTNPRVYRDGHQVWPKQLGMFDAPDTPTTKVG